MKKDFMGTREIIIIVFFVVIFFVISIYSNIYARELKSLIEFGGVGGMTIFIFLNILAEVIAPLTILPLLPIAANIWGSFTTAILGIIAWTAGAMIAFWLARRFGRPLVDRIINLEKVEEIGRAIPEKNLFWSTVFFRVAFPVDIVSYALGLFTAMRWRPYFLATILGIAPGAFVLSQAAVLPWQYQLVAGILGVIITIFGYRRVRRKFIVWMREKKAS